MDWESKWMQQQPLEFCNFLYPNRTVVFCWCCR
jgi:hypothetical protein